MRCTRRASSRSRSHASSTWKPSPQWKNYRDHKRLKLTNSLRVFRGRKTPHSKTVVRATVPRVLLPPHPPAFPRFLQTLAAYRTEDFLTIESEYMDNSK